MGYVKRKATSKATHNLLRISSSKYNLNETGIQLDTIGDWTMAPEGSKGVKMAGLEDKMQITVTFADTLNRAFHVHSCFIKESIMFLC